MRKPQVRTGVPGLIPQEPSTCNILYFLLDFSIFLLIMQG